MGQMRFFAPCRDQIPENAAARAYLAGIEGVPWQSRNVWESEHQLLIERAVDESCNLYMPWRVGQQGELVLSTASLMERHPAYHLPVELARGTLNRLRNQAADWQLGGLRISHDLNRQIRAATETFIRAATNQNDALRAAELAQQAMESALQAMELLGQEYTEQVLAMRHQQAPQLSTLLAGNVESKPLDKHLAEAFLATFNSAAIPFNWREIEPNAGEWQWEAYDAQLRWCHEHGLRICGGPLVRLSRSNLPDWVYLWEDDFEQLEACVLQSVETTVARYHDKVALWHAAARLNLEGALAISEEQRLHLAVRSIEVVRRTDPHTPVLISFDQPWAEYLAQENMDLSPIHFADALARLDLGIAGLGLEINLGYWPGGTLPRDVLEFSRQVDRWSLLGLPLLIVLTVPSSQADDPSAVGTAKPLAEFNGEGPTPENQQRLIERLVPLLMSKQSVHGLIWNQLDDAQPHDFAHGGIFDADHHPKPMLSSLATFRRAHLT